MYEWSKYLPDPLTLYVSISMCNVNDHVNYTAYTIDKFHIQWCLYPKLDLWNIINEWVNEWMCIL